ncbi:MAG TPA: DUF4388 domain-containing protein, partial [Polyangia bacterium]
DGDDGGVVGLLEDYGLYVLVRALAVAGRSCVMELERGRRLGEVQVSKGAVVAARVGRMTGVPAFHHLLLWGEASLSLRFESPAAERRIAAGVDELLEGGATFAREFEAIASRVGGPLAVYAHEPRRAAEQRGQIPAEVMVLVKQYDGRKPLIDIVEDSPFKPFDTIKITYRLAQLGAIVRKETRESTPLTERLAVRDWLLGDGEPERERPPTGAAGGVTEAGRRAAEAYAAEAARRAEEKSPGDDILDDSAAVRAAAARVAPGKPAATKPKKEPTAPKKEPAASKKEPTAPKKATAPAKKAAAPKKEGAPKKEAPAKLTAQGVAAASPKEPMFDAVDEEFFAREAELWHAPPADTFDDLEPNAPRGKRPPPRRDWFGLNKKK